MLGRKRLREIEQELASNQQKCITSKGEDFCSNRNESISSFSSESLPESDLNRSLGGDTTFNSIRSLFISRSGLSSKKKSPELQRVCNLLKWQGLFVFSLTVIWGVGMLGFLSLVDPIRPRVNARNGGLSTPGLSFRPSPLDPYSTLIHFRHGGSGNWQSLLGQFKFFLKEYSFGKRPGNSIICNWKTQLNEIDRCHVGNRKWMALDTDVPCTGAEKFGMYHGKPCVILKMNKVYGWQPEPYYNITQIQSLPTMPDYLKTYISAYWESHCSGKGDEIENRCPQMRMVWLSCEGESPADTENAGKIHFVPWQGFPGYHYPYLNQEHYVSPLVFIQFREIMPGIVIQIRCKLWAKNIKHDRLNPRKGGVHFEIMMD